MSEALEKSKDKLCSNCGKKLVLKATPCAVCRAMVTVKETCANCKTVVRKKPIPYWSLTSAQFEGRCRFCFRDPWLSIIQEMVCCMAHGIERRRAGNELILRCVGDGKHHDTSDPMFPYYNEVTPQPDARGKGKQRSEHQ